MHRTFILACVLLPTLVLTGCEARQTVAERELRTQQLILRGEAYLERGLTDSALAAFGLALQENPQLTEAHLGMGNIHRDRGNYEWASRSYERATQSDPNNFDAHYNLAQMRQLMGQIELAVRTYLRALTIDPESPLANRDLAAAYLQLDRPGDALPYARKAASLRPNDPAAWTNLATAMSRTGQYEDAINIYRQAADLSDEPAEPILLGLADAHIRLGNYQRAINVLEALLRTHESASAHERLGYAMFKLRRFDDAMARFERALALDPDHVAALNGIGVCLMTEYLLNDRQDATLHRRAVDAWHRSLQLRPDQSHILDLLARFGRG